MEALARAAGILSFKTMDTSRMPILCSISSASTGRVSKPVMPGDQLHLHVEIMRQMRGIWNTRPKRGLTGRWSPRPS